MNIHTGRFINNLLVKRKSLPNPIVGTWFASCGLALWVVTYDYSMFRWCSNFALHVRSVLDTFADRRPNNSSRNIPPPASVWRKTVIRCLSADIICSEKQTVFWEQRSRKTVSFEEQIMSKDPFPSTFPLHMRAVRCLLNITFRYFRNACSLRWGIFTHVIGLDIIFYWL